MQKSFVIIVFVMLTLLRWTAPIYADDAGTADRTAYYQSRIDEALDSARQGHAYRAILMVNTTLTEMEDENYKHTGMVYAAMGSIFQSKANIHMAEHYYRLALENGVLNDILEKMEIQAQMASLLKLWKPAEALHWNEEYASTCIGYPQYHQRYLFVNAIAHFALGNATATNNACKAYEDYLEEKGNELTNYGRQAIEAIRLAAEGDLSRALLLLNEPCEGLSEPDRYELRALLCQHTGDWHRATDELRQRQQLTDSLGSMLFFENMNEISTKAEIDKTRQQAREHHNRLFYIILLLAALLIAYMAYSIVRFRASRLRLKKKNEQLATALSMAEESDKMKSDFVCNVSHEIRTPLNAINGFNDILNNNEIPLSDEERAEILGRINENVDAITAIVNELLEMANENSGLFYLRNDTIFCNQFFSQLLYRYQQQVSKGVELRYTTKVINRFKIISNKEAVEQVMDHLIQNAIKFTERGSITVNCSEVGNMLLVSVADTGQGVTLEAQDTIFEQFAKGNSFKQGIGLGLTVARKIAQRLGGDLMLDKQYTQGACFILSLPIDG